VQTIVIRPATPADAGPIAEIYNEGILEQQSTFETDLRSGADVATWTDGPVPLLVAERDGEVLGWARVAPYSSRPCYSGVAEASIYVGARARRQGVGAALIGHLQREAEAAGLHKLIGKLFPDNLASRRLMARHGFREVGTQICHGQLDGEWRDVLLVERLLGSAGRAAAARKHYDLPAQRP
jgi:L-amino acid N-acyltransferase YncA